MLSAGEPSQPLSQQQLRSASNRLSNTSKRAARSFRCFQDARARTADSTCRGELAIFPQKWIVSSNIRTVAAPFMSD